MAHIEKCQGGKARGLILHDERSQGVKDNHIDTKLSHLNYNLCDHGDGIAYMNKRIAEVTQGKTVRKDAVKAISLIVTCPKDLPESEQKDFLRSAASFAEMEFGKQNIICAWCHFDEPGAMPHIHIKAVPIVRDRETGEEKLSAKALVHRSYLRRFHPRLQKYVEKELGHPVSIINGATSKKNLEIADLKAKAAEERVEEAERKLAAINAEYESKKAYVEAFTEEHESITKDVKENRSITGKVKSVEMSLEKWQRHAISYADKQSVLQMQNQIEEYIKEFQSVVWGDKHIELKRKLEEWEKLARKQIASNKLMVNEIEGVNEVFREYPEIARKFFEAKEAIQERQRAQEAQERTKDNQIDVQKENASEGKFEASEKPSGTNTDDDYDDR